MGVGLKLGWLAAAVLLLTGCASLQAKPVGPPVERIVYETSNGPFCGRCEKLKLTVFSDGQLSIERGHWAGRYSDWRVRRQSLRVPPEQIAQFRERLAPYRPTGSIVFNGPPLCETLTGDLPEITISWLDSEREDRLAYNFGCGSDTEAARAKRDALRSAPTILGVASPLD